ncbi:MAG TPA: hypothetical protein VGK48_07920 [Terriglobia bacterium]|jgi:hypothetical protein
MMSSPPIQFHKIWVEQCEATGGIRQRFGLDDALQYLIGEKLFSFVDAAEDDADFASELPAFVTEIRRIFSEQEIRSFLDELEHDKFLAPNEADLGIEDETDEFDDEEETILPNPVRAAEELLRFSRIRQLLTE